MRLSFDRTQLRELAIVAAPAALIVAGAFWLTAQFMRPAPPASFKITTGGETGAYYAFAERYKEIVERSGIAVEVEASKGSVENLARLKDPASGFSAGFIQGGIVEPADGEAIISLGRMFYEPVWIFHVVPGGLAGLQELKGLRLAIGPERSGTRPLALKLLAANGIGEHQALLREESGRRALEALIAGGVDAAFFVSAPEAPLIQEMLANANLQLLDNPQAEAYTRRLPFLARLTLPKGAIDLVREEPPSDLELVATTAALVVRRDTHPALADLLTQAALEVHGRAGLFNRAGEFPQASDPELPLSEDARRIYGTGAPFLQRYLPFWLANFAERAFIMLVPILTILLPMFQVAPWLYEMRVRARILYWYGQLTKAEKVLGEIGAATGLERHRAEIERIDAAVSKLPVPLPYVEQVYELRANIDTVRQRIAARLSGGEDIGSAAPVL